MTMNEDAIGNSEEEWKNNCWEWEKGISIIIIYNQSQAKPNAQRMATRFFSRRRTAAAPNLLLRKTTMISWFSFDPPLPSVNTTTKTIGDDEPSVHPLRPPFPSPQATFEMTTNRIVQAEPHTTTAFVVFLHSPLFSPFRTTPLVDHQLPPVLCLAPFSFPFAAARPINGQTKNSSLDNGESSTHPMRSSK